MDHSMVTIDNKKLYETEESAYLFMNVIRNPNPMKIITCTSM